MRHIAVTGLGVVSPVGVGRRAFWDALLEGRCGVGPVESFDTSCYRVHVGTEVKDFEAADHVSNLDPESLGRGSQMAVAAARLAVDDAGLDL